MMIEITGASVNKDKIVEITGIDVSEENLQKMEDLRDDGFERELRLIFDTKNHKDLFYFYKWIHSQKAAADSKTYHDALNSIVGTIVTISGKYLVWD